MRTASGRRATLRQLIDHKGQALVDGVLEIVDRLKPLHLSIVGGDPLVRYRELELLPPQLFARGVHVQLVTSAFRTLGAGWADMPLLHVVVSIDGLQPEHDVRRAPATYERILKNIVGHEVTVHCTVTGQMMKRAGYWRSFWNSGRRGRRSRKFGSVCLRRRLGDRFAGNADAAERLQAIEEMLVLRKKYPKFGYAGRRDSAVRFAAAYAASSN